MVSQVVGVSEEAERRARGRVSARGENGGCLSMACPRVKIRSGRACGAMASTTDSGRLGDIQCCEHGYRSVTNSVAGGTGLVIGPER
jgi:hypothetical protein